VYGFGDENGCDDAAYPTLSRFDHTGLNTGCADPLSGGNELAVTLRYSGCLHCHGGRKDQNSYGNPASTTVQSGAIHGTTMTEQSGGAGADNMGLRFMNGASWSSHTLGDVGGSLTCYTVGSDNYSACGQHGGGRSATPVYYYDATP
jgi:hypothetical protein